MSSCDLKKQCIYCKTTIDKEDSDWNAITEERIKKGLCASHSCDHFRYGTCNYCECCEETWHSSGFSGICSGTINSNLQRAKIALKQVKK